MAIASTYNLAYEAEYKKTGSIEKAHAVAKRASKMPVKKKKKKMPIRKKEGLLKRTARKLRELYYGPKTYSKKKFTPSLKNRRKK